jgi:23S rRNA pseudouridine2605 synthase
MRLQKYLAHCGIASRRKSEELIQQGRVMVNGQIITEMGYKIDLIHDEVLFDKKLITPENRRVVILINKPTGYVTTNKDQFNRKTVVDLISDIPERLVPVGRLDYHSSGLLLLTNDGDLTYQLTHPKHHIPKIYLVKIDGVLTQQQIDQFRNGMVIDDYRTKTAGLEVVSKTVRFSVLKITLHEGRNRQIRKMIEQLGCEVMELERIAIGNISDSTLKPGEYRYLTKNEIKSIKGE